MKKKFLNIFIILLLSIFFYSCHEDTTQLAKDEFSKYYNGKDEVVLNIEDNIYFENRVLKCESFEPKNSYGSIVFFEDLIYYMSINSLKKKYRNEYINIYSCDYYGENTNVIYSKEINTNSDITVKINKDSYYIEYKKDKLTYIDKYTISTGIYENIASGKDCNIFSYIPKEEQNRFSIELIENASPQEHGKFIITDLETKKVKTIDDNYLRDTIYIESMEKFNYGPKRVDISNGHILLTYSIGAGDGWNYPHLVFEYNCENEMLEYKLLVFPYDNVPVELIYIE